MTTPTRHEPRERRRWRPLVAVAAAAMAATGLVNVTNAPAAEAYNTTGGCRISGSAPSISVQRGIITSDSRWNATSGGVTRWNAESIGPSFTTTTSSGDVFVDEVSSVESYEAVTSGSCSGGVWGGQVTITWNTPSPGGVSGTVPLRTIGTHELGHVIGLNHVTPTCTGTPAVMVQGSNKWDCGWGTEPWADDVAGVNSLY